MSLTKEELAELADLEQEDKARKSAIAEAAQRQHLEALRLSKRLAAKHGTPGHDYVVLETTLGNIAIRRPLDIEADTIDESSGRADLEKLATAITLEPATADLQKLMAENPGLVGAITRQAIALCKVEREAEAKK